MPETVKAVAKAANPYIAGRALSEDRGFFGREDILDLVETELSSPDRNAVVLFGQRQIGKTSLLLQLRRWLPGEAFLPVYFDLMDRASTPLGKVLYDFASAIAESAGQPSPQLKDFDEDGQYFRREFLPGILSKTAGRRLVMMLDEFDVLDPAEDRQLPPSAAGRAFFPFIRRLMDAEARPAYVIALGRRTEDLSVDGKAAFKTARYQRVSLLDEASSRELIRAGEMQATISYANGAVDRIFSLTAGHPYFTQLLCHVIWDEARKPKGAGPTPVVSAAVADSMTAKANEAGQNIFEWIWDALPPAERVVASAIAIASNGQTAVAASEIQEALQRHGIRFLTRELELAPETLVKWAFLEQKDNGYRFPIEMMRRWIAARKPITHVNEELDRVVPLADSLFQSGDGFYRRGNLDTSRNLLQQALTINPNHLKARLLLSQVFMEEGRIDEAVRELEETNKFDEAAARGPLVRMLLMREEELERSGDQEKALAICERVLELVPGETTATDRRSAIWRMRGDRALESNQLDTAAAAFEKIGATDMLDKVAELKRKAHVEALVRNARGAAAATHWEQAADLYQQLIVLEPEDPQWKEALEKAEAEQNLAKTYAQAVSAMTSSNYRKAQALLIEVLRTRPEHKEAQDLLVLALRPARPVQETKPSLNTWLENLAPIYVKCVIGIVVLVVAGLIKVNANSDPGSTFIFYLVTAIVLALVLAIVEVIWQRINNVWQRERATAGREPGLIR